MSELFPRRPSKLQLLYEYFPDIPAENIAKLETATEKFPFDLDFVLSQLAINEDADDSRKEVNKKIKTKLLSLNILRAQIEVNFIGSPTAIDDFAWLWEKRFKCTTIENIELLLKSNDSFFSSIAAR